MPNQTAILTMLITILAIVIVSLFLMLSYELFIYFLKKKRAKKNELHMLLDKTILYRYRDNTIPFDLQ